MRAHEPVGHDPVWWSGGLDADRPRPLVVLLTGALGGGQECGHLLDRLVRRGHAVVAARVPHSPSSAAAAVAGIIDRHADRAVTSHTRVVGFDLGGRAALEAAAADGRVRAVHLVGTPVVRLYAEPDHQRALPPTVTAALVRATGAGRRDRLPDALTGLSLRPEELHGIDAAVRVGYAHGDPLTPPQDLALLRLTVRDVTFRSFPAPYRAPTGGRAVRRWLARDLRHLRTASP
jgi:dienelactone hydrolase